MADGMIFATSFSLKENSLIATLPIVLKISRKRMSKYDEVNMGKTLYISGISAALSQFAEIYDSKMMKEISDITRNPILTENV